MNTLARIKKIGKNFEIIVDMDEAINFKHGKTDFLNVQGDKIFSDSKKGMSVSPSDLKKAFGTDDTDEVGKRIVKEGEILVSQKYRDAEQEKKIKQVVDFLANNAIDPQTGNPITSERLKSALEEAKVNVKNIPLENQITEIIKSLSEIIPIKLETKRVKIRIPAIYTGHVYGIINQYKEKENWFDNGDLEVVVAVPSGLIMDFYDRLNSVTHGAAFSEEMKGER